MTSIDLPTSSYLREHLQKVVLVTGAASGIGFATARLFAEHCARVVLVDLDTPALRTAAESIGDNCSYYACDVSSWEQQVALYDWVCRSYGPPEIVCLNAGIDPELAATETPSAKEKVASNYLADEFETSEAGCRRLRAPPDAIFDVNVKGVIYGLKLAVHSLVEWRGGRIIITGSAASYIPVAYQDVYAASKHALIGLVRSTSRRQELKEKNIAISMIAPWFTRTPLTANIPSEMTQGSEASEPEDVALGIAYLATAEKEEDVNGRCLWVRGKRCIEIETTYERWLGEMMQV